MAKVLNIEPNDERELVLARLLDAPVEKVFRCWTDPKVIPRWFTPAPWTTPRAEVDLRPGGANFVLMRGPNGEEVPNHGVYLEVVLNRKLVFTDAYVRAWEPSPKPFMTVTLTFEPEGDGTRYVARVAHWTIEDRKAHEQMGFETGWGICADQLEATARSL